MLPFELHVLEVAIGDVCALCTELVKELESSSHPALDALTKHVSLLGSCSNASAQPCKSVYGTHAQMPSRSCNLLGHNRVHE